MSRAVHNYRYVDNYQYIKLDFKNINMFIIIDENQNIESYQWLLINIDIFIDSQLSQSIYQ